MSLTNRPLIGCSVCKGTGRVQRHECAACHGKIVGYFAHDRFLFWNHTIDTYSIQYRGIKRQFDAALSIVLGLFLLACVGLFIFKITQSGFDASTLPLLGFGGLALFFLISRNIRLRPIESEVAPHSYLEGADDHIEKAEISWEEVHALPQSKVQNISTAFTHDALQTIEDAYGIAAHSTASHVTPFHLLRAILANTRIQSLCMRLLVPLDHLQAAVDACMVKEQALAQPILSTTVWQIIFNSYEEAWMNRSPVVDVTDIFLTVVSAEQKIADLFFDFGVKPETLHNGVEWVRVREQMKRARQRRIRGSHGRSKKGDINRAMTAIATPFLNSLSQDLTRASLYGALEPLIGRDAELETIFRILQGGSTSVLLVGNHGVGKETIINGIAELMVAENVPEILSDKRLVELDLPKLLAGASPVEAEERLLELLNELSAAGNIILVIPSIEKMIGITIGQQQSLDVASVLATELGKGNFLTIATTTPEAYNRTIANQQLATVLQKVDIDEMDLNAAIRVLEAKAGFIEFKHSVWFSYEALERAAQMCQRYLHDTYLPQNAIEICNEVAQHVRNKRGKEQLITADDVATIIAQRTKIPVTAVTENETDKLLRLETEMHRRVIGQDEAVTLVANALRRARAEIRSNKRPIANFLFLGPTGVGKTELTKTIAEVYFGSESQMVRIDMSEYQDTSGIYRLIGQPNQQGTGILTEAIRQKPFSLVLLDELEKADPNILNLFLQVMDDGRLTDSVGRVIDFTNVILIATSNAGTQFVQEQIRAGTSGERIKTQLLHGELKQYFKPEFLNRFDAVVLFSPLTESQIGEVARNILRGIGKKLEERGVLLEMTDAGVAELAAAGYDPEFGARPLRRVIQDRVENAIAGMLLQNQLNRKDTVVIDAGGVTIKKG